MFKFRPSMTTLESRDNPSGPDLMDNNIPTPPPQTPPQSPPTPPDNGPAPSNPNNPVH